MLPSLNKVAPIKVIYELVRKLKNYEIIILYLSNKNDLNYRAEFELLKNVKLVRNKKTLQLIKESDFLICNGFRPNLFIPIAKYLGKKTISICHSVENVDFVNSRGLIKGRIGAWLNSALYKRSDLVVAVSMPVLHYLISRGVHLDNSLVLENKLEFGEFNPGSEDFDFIQVGVFSETKNQIFTLKILKELQTEKIITFAGDYNNTYGERCIKFIEDNDLQGKVRLLGHINEAELDNELIRHRYLLMPSLTEGFPLSPLEGFKYGLKAIVSPNGGLSELIKSPVLGVNLELNESQWISYLEGLGTDVDKKKIFDCAKSFYDIENNITLFERVIDEKL